MAETIPDKPSHQFTDYGVTRIVGEDSIILIDNWKLPSRLFPSRWEGAEFEVASNSLSGWTPVNIRITGRTAQRRAGDYWIRIAVEFPQDGEPAIQHSGWALRDSLPYAS